MDTVLYHLSYSKPCISCIDCWTQYSCESCNVYSVEGCSTVLRIPLLHFFLAGDRDSIQFCSILYYGLLITELCPVPSAALCLVSMPVLHFLPIPYWFFVFAFFCFVYRRKGICAVLYHVSYGEPCTISCIHYRTISTGDFCTLSSVIDVWGITDSRIFFYFFLSLVSSVR